MLNTFSESDCHLYHSKTMQRLSSVIELEDELCGYLKFNPTWSAPGTATRFDSSKRDEMLRKEQDAAKEKSEDQVLKSRQKAGKNFQATSQREFSSF